MKRYIFLTILVIMLISLKHTDKNSLKNTANQDYIKDMISFNKIFFKSKENIKVDTMVKKEESKTKEILEIVKKYDIFEFIMVRIKNNRVYIGVEVGESVSIIKYVNTKIKIKKEILKEYEEIKDVILTEDISLLESID